MIQVEICGDARSELCTGDDGKKEQDSCQDSYTKRLSGVKKKSALTKY